jgi:DNA repair protein RecO (recombination protein O)
VNDQRDEAVVLRAYRSGEADRVVVLFTKDHGKVRAIAKGVRKPTTKIGGGLEPLAHVRVFLAVGKSPLAIVRQVEHVRQYTTVHGSMERLTAALAVVEATDAIPADDLADPEIFELLTRTLATLDDEQYAPALVPAAYFLRLLVHDGSEPMTACCAHCGAMSPLVAFDAAVGGTLCPNCRSGRSLSPDALALLQRLLGGQLGTVLRSVEPPGSAEVTLLANDALEHHYGKRLRVLRSAPSAS